MSRPTIQSSQNHNKSDKVVKLIVDDLGGVLSKEMSNSFLMTTPASCFLWFEVFDTLAKNKRVVIFCSPR